mmetsp:Transcript_41295/g.108417  ORF Transcript_41295/g.108417 Transcript_41295/m.108417 type:complete len:240 (-) Transcript_41295:1914-2633(-)
MASVPLVLPHTIRALIPTDTRRQPFPPRRRAVWCRRTIGWGLQPVTQHRVQRAWDGAMPQFQLHSAVLFRGYVPQPLGVELREGVVADGLDLQHSHGVTVLERRRQLQIPVNLLVLRRSASQSSQVILSPRSWPIIATVAKLAMLMPLGKSSEVPHATILCWAVQTGTILVRTGDIARLGVIHRNVVVTAVLATPKLLEFPVSHRFFQLNRGRHSSSCTVWYYIPDSKRGQERHHISLN